MCAGLAIFSGSWSRKTFLRQTTPRRYFANGLMNSRLGPVGSKILDGGVTLAKIVKPQELYYVSRTKSNNLPVYKQTKRGGNKLQTKVQKVEGDAQQLKKQLIVALGVDAADVQVNGLTKHVIIKGWKMDEVKQFLEKKHF